MKVELKSNKEGILCFLFFMPQVNYYIAAILSSYGIQTITSFVYFFLILVGTYSFLTSLGDKRCFLWSFGMVAVLLLSINVDWDVKQYIFSASFASSPVVMLCTIYFPIFLIFLSLVDLGKLIRIAVKYSIITIVLSLIAFANYVFVQRQSMPDYMTFAYMIVSPIMICMISAIQEAKINALWAVAGFIVILVGGCRGALVTVSLFFIFCFIRFFTTAGKGRTTVIKCIVAILVILLTLNIDHILSGLALVLEGFGYKSRVFATLAGTSYGGETNTFFSGDGRIDIWKMSWDHIRVIGYGLFGDRVVVRNEYNNASYAHNWLLEMLVSFGWIAGLIAITFVLWVVIKGAIMANRRKDSTLILLSYSVFCIIMVKHFISASFASSIDFWFYLGVGYCIIETENVKMIEVVKTDGNQKIKSFN